LIHNINYSYNGVGYLVLNIFGTLFDMLSECTMTLLLLMMANGWMTRFHKYDIDDGLDIWAPLFMMVLLVHIVFGALIYID
jgi:hypothetical protein